MADFTTRVELYGAALNDYKKLKAAMIALKFSKTVFVRGKYYVLPPGEYTSKSNGSEEYVAKLASKAAGSVWRDYSVVTTKSAGRFFINLPLAK